MRNQQTMKTSTNSITDIWAWLWQIYPKKECGIPWATSLHEQANKKYYDLLKNSEIFQTLHFTIKTSVIEKWENCWLQIEKIRSVTILKFSTGITRIFNNFVGK